jgi:NADH dehydrogenase
MGTNTDQVTTAHRVVVLGAGYAGILAANRIRASLTTAEAGRVRVTMVNRTPEFIERVRLHEVAAGVRPSAALPLGQVLHEGVEVVVGTVLRIDAPARTLSVATPDGETIEGYDTLIYAVGSMAALGAPGVEDHAHLLGNANGAESARRAIDAGPVHQRIVVVGGGATGVEAAAEIAERHPAAQVTLLSRGPLLGHLPTASRKHVLRSLGRLGVTTTTGSVSRVLADAVELADGTRVPSDVTVWTASFAVPDLARRSGLPVDGCGCRSIRRSSARATPCVRRRRSGRTCGWAAPSPCLSAATRPTPFWRCSGVGPFHRSTWVSGCSASASAGRRGSSSCSPRPTGR